MIAYRRMMLQIHQRKTALAESCQGLKSSNLLVDLIESVEVDKLRFHSRKLSFRHSFHPEQHIVC